MAIDSYLLDPVLACCAAWSDTRTDVPRETRRCNALDLGSLGERFTWNKELGRLYTGGRFNRCSAWKDYFDSSSIVQSGVSETTTKRKYGSIEHRISCLIVWKGNEHAIEDK